MTFTPFRIILHLQVFFGLSLTLGAQNKNDFTWLLGVPNQTTDPYHGGDYIDFSEGDLNASYVNLPLDMWYPNIMSDEQGQLSFYNNGCKIMDANHQLMDNGQDINAGLMHQLYCDSPNHPIGYPSYQGQITLPYPGHPGEYIYFHLWTNDEYLQFLYERLLLLRELLSPRARTKYRTMRAPSA